jgi:hypothetical protein
MIETRELVAQKKRHREYLQRLRAAAISSGFAVFCYRQAIRKLPGLEKACHVYGMESCGHGHLCVCVCVCVCHGHGHGHGIFILATHLVPLCVCVCVLAFIRTCVWKNILSVAITVSVIFQSLYAFPAVRVYDLLKCVASHACISPECQYLCMHACKYECMCISSYVNMYICIYACIVCVYVCVCVCVCV